VLEVIRKDVAEDKVRIDTPTQNLESYFLNVVNKAREQEAATSGATSGNRVAEYLRAGADAGPTQQAKVLDRLTRSEEVTTSAPAPVVQVTNVESLSNKKLEQLTKQEEGSAAPERSPEKPRQADLGKANEKLSSLLNKPK
jgi:ABC-2 type transport system ATP-binding protein